MTVIGILVLIALAGAGGTLTIRRSSKPKREQCASNVYRREGGESIFPLDRRCPGIDDPRCVAGNCTACCNLHCKGRCSP